MYVPFTPIETAPLPGPNNRGVALALSGYHEHALVMYRTALEDDPEDRAALVNLGISLEALGSPVSARRSYEAAWRAGEPSATLRLGCRYARDGRDDLAMERFEAYPSRMNDSCALINMAVSLSRSNEHARAESLMRRALDMEPRNPAALNNMGCLLAKAGRYEESWEHYVAARRVPGAWWPASFNMTLLLARGSQHMRAIRGYLALLGQIQFDDNVLARALACLRVGAYKDAGIICSRALPLLNRRLRLLVGAALSYDMLDDEDVSRRCFVNAVSTLASIYRTQEYMSLSLAGRGLYAESRKCHYYVRNNILWYYKQPFNDLLVDNPDRYDLGHVMPILENILGSFSNSYGSRINGEFPMYTKDIQAGLEKSSKALEFEMDGEIFITGNMGLRQVPDFPYF